MTIRIDSIDVLVPECTSSDFMKAAWALARAGNPNTTLPRRVGRAMKNLRAMGPSMAAEVASVLAWDARRKAPKNPTPTIRRAAS